MIRGGFRYGRAGQESFPVIEPLRNFGAYKMKKLILTGLFFLTLILGPSWASVLAQDDSGDPKIGFNSNPTHRLVLPRRDQSPDQQLVDQEVCFQWTSEEIDWDPYLAYDRLVEEGYAEALSREQMAEGLVCLAAKGVVAGTVAGEILGKPGQGADIGLAVALASGLIHSDFLVQPDDPASQRVVTRYQRNLKKWERKYAGCLSRKGYRVVFE